MKMLLIAKISVFIMTFLILAGLTVVVLKITDNVQKNKPQNQSGFIELSENEQIIHLSPCDKYLCLLTEKSGQQNRLLIMNPNTGKIRHHILLKTQ